MIHQSRRHRVLKAKRILAARRDVNAFVEYCGKDDKGRWIEEQEGFHREWQDFADANPCAIIMGPRGHAKSTQLIVFRSIYKMGRWPNRRIKIVSNDMGNAKKRVKAIRTNIDHNDRVKEVFPDLIPSSWDDDWTAATLTVKRDTFAIEPTLEARAVFSTGTGGRCDELLLDDICDRKNSLESPSERQKVKTSFWNDWFNLLDDEGILLYLATPWHRDDLTHDLIDKAKKNQGWVLLERWIDKELNPLWPSKWSRAKLLQKMQRMPRSEFNMAYLGIPYSDENRIFLESSIENVKDRNLPLTAIPEITKNWPKYSGVDIASGSQSKKAKYSVIFTVAVNPETGVRIPVDIRRGKWRWKEFTFHLKDVNKRWKPVKFYVENNATQELIVQAMKAHLRNTRGRSLPIEGHHTGKEKMRPEIGVPSMACDFDNGLWRLPFKVEHPVPCKCNLCAFLAECELFPEGGTIDLLMGAWMATRHLEESDIDLSHLESWESESYQHLEDMSETSRTSGYSGYQGSPIGSPYEDGW